MQRVVEEGTSCWSEWRNSGGDETFEQGRQWIFRELWVEGAVAERTVGGEMVARLLEIEDGEGRQRVDGNK